MRQPLGTKRPSRVAMTSRHAISHHALIVVGNKAANTVAIDRPTGLSRQSSLPTSCIRADRVARASLVSEYVSRATPIACRWSNGAISSKSARSPGPSASSTHCRDRSDGRRRRIVLKNRLTRCDARGVISSYVHDLGAGGGEWRLNSTCGCGASMSASCGRLVTTQC